MKYLIVGLGNPDKEYDGTRHNIGYRVVDSYLDKLNQTSNEKYSFSTDRYAFKCETKLMGRQVILIKPTTYMNLSGKAVRYWLDKEKIPVENLFIIVDDLALELGTIRLRLKGSDGGHNGLKNIIEMINTTTFNRMRFGIGNDFRKGGQIDFVLGKLNEEEEAIVKPQIDKTFDIIKSFVMIGMDKTMNKYNGK
ncbi:MAG: aminoacyl-tRNA hydrolase [Bacteroidales bacterium]|jgi:PTH1 family peptidyl-tRNA hydrolase|nr:aminoacyl-tRNA hydrolase [Bacteroidales bacterium]